MKKHTRFKSVIKWVAVLVIFSTVFAVLFEEYVLATSGINSIDHSYLWIFYIIILAALSYFVARFIIRIMEKKDEREIAINQKALSITYIALICEAVVIILSDLTTPIKTPYFLVMTFVVCVSLIFYKVSYKIISKHN